MDHLLLNERPHPYRPDESPLIGDLRFDFFRKEEIAICILIIGRLSRFPQEAISGRINTHQAFDEDRLKKMPTSGTFSLAVRHTDIS
jgi:hypothetical protein